MFPIKTLGVIGGGVVGSAIAKAFTEWCEVRVYDAKRERSTNGIQDTIGSDLLMLCLPTPAKTSGKTTLAFIEQTSLYLQDRKLYELPVVIRSTIPIGTTRYLQKKYDLNICHSPEFLTARCAFVDAQVPTRNIIGATGHYHDPVRCAPAVLDDVYRARWPHLTTHHLSSEESEAVKLFTNSFFAVKVSLFNEFKQLADKLSLNWKDVVEVMLTDGRIHPSHTQVPGPDGHHGFGGACLPKDIQSLAWSYIDAGLQPQIVQAAINRNVYDRKRL